MVRFLRRSFVFVVPAALLAMSAVLVAAQSLPPSLFTGKTRDASNAIIANASVSASISGQVCGETRSLADGSYAVVIPDGASRPAVCSAATGQVTFTVNGSPAGFAAKGSAGIPIPLDLMQGAAPPAPASAVVFADPVRPGVNSAVVTGTGSVCASTMIQLAMAQAQAYSTVLEVSAIWLFANGAWTAHVPRVFEQFTCLNAPVGLYFVMKSLDK